MLSHIIPMSIVVPEEISGYSKKYWNGHAGNDAECRKSNCWGAGGFLVLMLACFAFLGYIFCDLFARGSSAGIILFGFFLLCCLVAGLYALNELVRDLLKISELSVLDGIKRTKDDHDAMHNRKNILSAALLQDIQCLDRILLLRQRHNLQVAEGRAEDPSFLDDVDAEIRRYVGEVGRLLQYLDANLERIHQNDQVAELSCYDNSTPLLDGTLTNSILKPSHELVLMDALLFIRKRREALHSSGTLEQK